MCKYHRALAPCCMPHVGTMLLPSPVPGPSSTSPGGLRTIPELIALAVNVAHSSSVAEVSSAKMLCAVVRPSQALQHAGSCSEICTQRRPDNLCMHYFVPASSIALTACNVAATDKWSGHKA